MVKVETGKRGEKRLSSKTFQDPAGIQTRGLLITSQTLLRQVLSYWTHVWQWSTSSQSQPAESAIYSSLAALLCAVDSVFIVVCCYGIYGNILHSALVCKTPSSFFAMYRRDLTISPVIWFADFKSYWLIWVWRWYTVEYVLEMYEMHAIQ